MLGFLFSSFFSPCECNALRGSESLPASRPLFFLPLVLLLSVFRPFAAGLFRFHAWGTGFSTYIHTYVLLSPLSIFSSLSALPASHLNQAHCDPSLACFACTPYSACKKTTQAKVVGSFPTYLMRLGLLIENGWQEGEGNQIIRIRGFWEGS